MSNVKPTRTTSSTNQVSRARHASPAYPELRKLVTASKARNSLASAIARGKIAPSGKGQPEDKQGSRRSGAMGTTLGNWVLCPGVDFSKIEESSRQTFLESSSRSRGGDGRAVGGGVTIAPVKPLTRALEGIDPPFHSRFIRDEHGRKIGTVETVDPRTFLKRVTRRAGKAELEGMRQHARQIRDQRTRAVSRVGTNNVHGRLLDLGGGEEQVTVPGAIGYSFNSVPHLETQFVKNGMKVTQIAGSDYVCPVAIVDPTVAYSRVGQRIYAQPLAPVFFPGTRLEAEARLFQEYDLISLEFVYVPCTGTDTKGSLIMFKDDDAYEPAQSTGLNALRTADSHNCWVDFPMWETSTLEVFRNEALLNLFSNNEDGGDARLQMDGTFYAMLGPGHPTTGAYEYGSIHMRYVYSFMEPLLDITLPATTTWTNVLQFGTAVTAKTMVAGEPIVGLIGAAAAGKTTFTASLDPAHKYYFGVVVDWIRDGASVVDPNWYTQNQGSPGAGIAWLVGQAYFVRIHEEGDDAGEYTTATFHQSPGDALASPDSVSTQDSITGGQLRYSDDGDAVFQVILSMVEVDLADYS